MLIACLLSLRVFAQDLSTAHNFSASNDNQSNCSHCHSQHGMAAKPVLWNTKLSTVVYKIYQSTSLEAKVGQPTGSSKLCLSCHDGTVAPSESIKSDNRIRTYISAGESYLGTDLSDDHPISFTYTSTMTTMDPQIISPEFLPDFLTLGESSEM